MSNGSNAAARAPAAVLEDLASAVMSADASDARAVKALVALLDELPAFPAAAEAAARIREASSDLRALAEALDAASEAVARMQDELARGPAVVAAAAADPSAFVLSDFCDEKTFKDFLAAQKGALEELEVAILEMERGGAEPLTPADIADAVCEIVNMLAGGVQRQLRKRAGIELTLGLPTFFHGPVQPTERLGVAVAEISLGSVPAALLVLHPRR